MRKEDLLNSFLIFIIVIMGMMIIDLRSDNLKNFKSIVVQANKEKIIFAGDSITDGYDLNKYYSYDDKLIINSGVSGYKTTNIIKRFNNVIKQYHADKLFLTIGTNDIGAQTSNDVIVSNIEKILKMAREDTPNIKLYYETIYPIDPNTNAGITRKNVDIRDINQTMKEYCKKNNITYLDVYSILADDNGNLRKEYSKDGLHLNEEGYKAITKYLKKYVEE